MPDLGKAWRIIAVLVCAALLQACGATRLAYSQAPNLVHWWLDSHFDFSEDQSARMRESLAQVQAWHRREQLPRYADLLQQAQTLAAQPQLTADQVCAVFDSFQATLPALVQRMASAGGWLPATLGPAQYDHLRRHFGKGNAEFREEWLDAPAEALFERRLERAISRSESFYGRLSPSQRDLLRDHLRASPYNPAVAWPERQRRQQDLLATLRTGADGAQGAAALAAWATRALEPPGADALDHLRANLRHGCVGVARLHATTTAEQRSKAAEVLRGYERDVRDLASAR